MVLSEEFYNGTFYYVTNLQGDVVALVDESGNLIVEYTYDAWGKPLQTRYYSNIFLDYDDYNPLRYRGYVYDWQYGLYYLQSRYYDPEIGRFINADAFTSTGQGFVGNNMFAYCGNNPVNFHDPTGLCKYIHRGNAKIDCGRGDCSNSENYIPFTAAIGFSISFGIGPLAVSINPTIVTDCSGKSEFQISFTAPNIFSTSLPSSDDMLSDIKNKNSSYKFGISAGVTMSFTNAPSVTDLHGPTYSVGGAVSGLAVEYISMPQSNDSSGVYSGITICTGLITPGLNATMSNTFYSLPISISVFDVVEAACRGMWEV